jgi:hypothetical protein
MIGYVYAIGTEPPSEVKIGWSHDPRRRLMEFQVGNSRKLKLLGQVKAEPAQEIELHSLLDRWRGSGEWFRHEGPVSAFVDMLPRPHPTRSLSPMAYIRKHVFGVSQATMAAIAGASQGTISRWESGEHSPDSRALAAVRAEARRRGHDWDDRWFFDMPEVAS